MADGDADCKWYDVAFAIQSAAREAYLRGDRSGHERGWKGAWNRAWETGFESGVQFATAQDAEFAQMVEQEYHRRELQGESSKTLVRRLLDALRTEENRQRFDERRRAA
ncbi:MULTISPECIES: hypothetical protein [Brevibacterium]|uniref:Uncharacterized protein n=1 Tax=Brevibacterium antiquum CNRZ 918 TaxID=1255637 RepID=A0A2H1J2I2_9MICO|nr:MULTISPECIES: hypothetical protein [Brevibacterium]SMX81614.1 hypothetical protein BANT918_01356 [Brevibacterium antiquum CNRZ 918]HCG56408.1 hypothetical protein [Brevibacterium sp.]